jgi:DNA mismatch endonuclease (patch repair protein)
MQRTRRRDTPGEIALRRLLHRRGLRFRVDTAPLPDLRRRADIVFTRARVAVYLDGCYWHSCPDHGTKPRANAEWWATKLAANVARDRDTDLRLRAVGWEVVRVWEHEDPEAAAARVEAVYHQRINQAGTLGAKRLGRPSSSGVRVRRPPL